MQSSRSVQLAELGTFKSGFSPPPHTCYTLCHCQLALFQYFDGDHNENDADNDSDDSDDGDDVLLLTLFTLCANWRFSKGTAASKTLKVDL